uniref:Uncharacterized protein n=1 Tax=Vespula pensylvanica TaxID=30213 RepID=A0A834PCD2_VESPE|nr:hypothetical protein H0235_003641 [Vespula pensylvanica]
MIDGRSGWRTERVGEGGSGGGCAGSSSGAGGGKRWLEKQKERQEQYYYCTAIPESRLIASEGKSLSVVSTSPLSRLNSWLDRIDGNVDIPVKSRKVYTVEVMLKLDNDVDGCRSVMNHPARCYPDSFVGHPYHPCREVARDRWRSACSHALYVRVMFHAM